MQIPSNVYSKYDEVMTMFADSANFGVACKLVYKSIETITSSVPEVKQRLTMSAPHSQAGASRGTETTKIVETFEEVTFRLYWDKKNFAKISSIQIPEGGCMAIAPLSYIDNIRKCHQMMIYTNRENDLRFAKIAEPTIWGLNGSYCVSYWEKA